MLLGIERLHCASGRISKSQRWAMLTNDAATTQRLVLSRVAVLQMGYNVTMLLSPEHGIEATAADGVPVPHSTDAQTGLPVFSLYQSSPEAQPPWLEQVDGVLIDLPDIGCRFYTYIWSMSHVLEACAQQAKKVLVLDRPNPLSGSMASCEGPILNEETHASFIGRWAMPVRHSLTIGELALHWNKSRNFAADLEIIYLQGWQRDLYLPQTGVPFVPTSPAIASWESLLTYPMLCFCEGLNVNEGRGTAFPFRVCGSPWIRADSFAKSINALNLGGVLARPVHYKPYEGRYAGELCSGVMMHVTDVDEYQPIKAGLSLVALLFKAYGAQIAWATYPTLANPTGLEHFDLLCGNATIRRAIMQSPEQFLETGIHDATEVGGWSNEVFEFVRY